MTVAAVPSMEVPPARAWMFGVIEEPLRSLLTEVLGDLDVDLTTAPSQAPPHLAIVLVDDQNLTANLAFARVVARSVPILAVLVFPDDVLEARAIAAGAAASYALGTPLQGLRRAIASILGRSASARRRE